MTQSGRFADWDENPQKIVQLATFSDVIRTYDVSRQLSVPTTIDRVQYLLCKGSALDSKSYINAEDEAYVCSALSLEIGVMSNQLKKQDGKPLRLNSTESIRAVNWLSSFAPPFPINQGKIEIGKEVLFDECNFVNSGTWVSSYGDRVIKQGAPDFVMRNDDLPNVEYLDAEKTYIVSSRHPNGTFAVAVMPRFSQNKGAYTPRVKINIFQHNDLPIGIFGEIYEVNIQFNSSVEGQRIFAQDLASNLAVDITDKCVVNDSIVTISGDVISKIGQSQNSAGDESKPGLVIKLI